MKELMFLLHILITSYDNTQLHSSQVVNFDDVITEKKIKGFQENLLEIIKYANPSTDIKKVEILSFSKLSD